MNLIVVWILIALGVILIDIFTSAFMFSWFAIGALAAILANCLGVNLTGQVIIFAVIGLIAICIGYPIVKKKSNKEGKKIPLMEESYIGKVFKAQDDIVDIARIKVGGIYWTGVNKNHSEKISKGNYFKIVGIEGNKFIIEECEKEE